MCNAHSCKAGSNRLIEVHIRSHFIMNGVCVRWRGWIDLERLDGVGCLEFDEEKAMVEDAMLRDQIERYNQRLREFEEKQRAYRGQPQDHDLEVTDPTISTGAQVLFSRLSLRISSKNTRYPYRRPHS
ncbi:unnamed protein product [Nezara viridula]|uniref:Protein big brother n=1 Tax=Nezara viridula TaxID=85310 RepID=A0A9P0E5I8_NEZVI|nr:unnamed protein product [Nezara viridula]